MKPVANSEKENLSNLTKEMHIKQYDYHISQHKYTKIC